MSELVTREPRGLALHDMQPDEMMVFGTKVANALANVIRAQKLFSNIQGRDYVRLEGWLLMASFLGLSSREKCVEELEDGSFLATVEVFSPRTGQVYGQASALCGMDEKRWRGAEKYARRSMAVTRATGKAFRMNFSWIMSLAGYEPTPEEEMPGSRSGSNYYDNTNRAHQNLVIGFAKKLGITEPETWKSIGAALAASEFPVPLVDLEAAVAEVASRVRAS